MPLAHRNNDLRVCGAKTVVQGQSSVTIEGELWAVRDDPNDHEEGKLIPTYSGITIEGKDVIVHTPDLATADIAGHDPSLTKTATSAPDVSGY